MKTIERHPLMTSGEVAAMFRVRPVTVLRWTERGLLTERRTLGGHRHYDRAEVEALARANGIEP